MLFALCLPSKLIKSYLIFKGYPKNFFEHEMNLTVRRISGGDLYSKHSRAKRPPERQATETSSCIHCAAPDGA